MTVRVRTTDDRFSRKNTRRGCGHIMRRWCRDGRIGGPGRSGQGGGNRRQRGQMKTLPCGHGDVGGWIWGRDVGARRRLARCAGLVAVNQVCRVGVCCGCCLRLGVGGCGLRAVGCTRTIAIRRSRGVDAAWRRDLSGRNGGGLRTSSFDRCACIGEIVSATRCCGCFVGPGILAAGGSRLVMATATTPAAPATAATCRIAIGVEDRIGLCGCIAF